MLRLRISSTFPHFSKIFRSYSNKSNILVYNSLLKKKEKLVLPNERNANKLTWYSCGPTVYDVSHLGHGRTYVAIDVLIRVLTDYFRFDN